ncbi:MAG: helix-turn-helix transcriptional regulator [Candidatus Cloacimonetes bacterium]|nr:helix-turn-helix transcriptional regulator [Candidatus Cloacimonadota bacterium]
MVSEKSTQELFKEAISFRDDEDRLSFEAEMIHLDLMYKIQCLMDTSKINKTELAKLLGVSKGYLTQLFTGDKLLNLKTIAKLQRIFDVKLNLTLEHKESSEKGIEIGRFTNSNIHEFETLREQMNRSGWFNKEKYQSATIIRVKDSKGEEINQRTA